METVPMKIIARIHSDFPSKFGIPRQSGLVEALKARVVFEPDFRSPEAVRGLEGFSHIWLIWQFSQAVREDWSPTVRPPRLGGNTRMGVFATRSPFRPNAVGLSSVRLERVEPHTPQGPVLHVAGADLMDGTPIFDIKPYLPYGDCRPEATGGFAPGADRLLARLADSGISCCIATASEAFQARDAMVRLGLWKHFLFAFSSLQYGPKTGPDLYRAAARSLGSAPERTVVFEDALHAARSAKRAGFLVAGVYDPSAEEDQEALRCLCDWYLPRLDSPDFLAALERG